MNHRQVAAVFQENENLQENLAASQAKCAELEELVRSLQAQVASLQSKSHE